MAPDASSFATLESELAAIVASSQDAIVSKSLDGIIRSWNASATRIFGYRPEEIIGRSIRLLVPEDLRAEEDYILFRISQGEQISNYETERLTKDGIRLSINLTVSPIRDETGRIVGASKIARNITREKINQRLIDDSRKLMNLASEAAHLESWIYYQSRDEFEWSNQCAQILGPTLNRVKSRDDFIACYTEEDQKRIRDAFSRCSERGTSFDLIVGADIEGRGKRSIKLIGHSGNQYNESENKIYGSIQDVTELIEAKQNATTNEVRLRSILNTITEGFYTLDRDFRFTFINRTVSKIFGSPAERHIGRKIHEVFENAKDKTSLFRIEKAMQTQTPYSLVEFNPNFGRWLDIHAYPTGEGIAVYFRDVTERIEQQEELRLLHTAISRTQDMVLVFEGSEGGDKFPNIVYANDAFLRATKYERSEVIGKSPEFLIGENTSREAIEKIGDAVRNWNPLNIELLNYDKMGNSFWVELNLAPISDKKGKDNFWVAVQRDISRRVEFEKLSAIERERLSLVAKATSNAIWDFDVSEGTVWWSEGLHEKFGYDVRSINVEESLQSWIAESDRARVRVEFENFLSSDRKNWRSEYTFLCADRRSREVEVNAVAIRNVDGVPVRVVGGITDISDKHHLEEQLRQSQKLEAIGQLTGGVAHDFNNLLTVIVGTAELLEENPKSESDVRYLAEMIRISAERGAHLADRLLAFGRRQPLNPESTDVNKLISGIEFLLRQSISDNIEFRFSLHEALCPAHVDRPQLESAILNLCLNARDAMKSGGVLRIKTYNCRLEQPPFGRDEEFRPGDFVVVEVTDNGVGMDRPTLERAFEPFFTTKPKGEGTGLGLSMVYGFAKQSNGFVDVTSELGNGTTVQIFLPQSDSLRSDRPNGSSNNLEEGGSETILVVEDSTLVREYVVMMLKSLGYDVRVAINGNEAIELLERGLSFELLFTDVVMPGGIDGWQVATRATELFPEISVLFTTGYTDNAIVQDGQLKKNVHLLKKPYRRKELAQMVRSALDQSKASGSN